MHLSCHLRGSFFIRNVNASKKSFSDCATQTNLCSLPSANSLIHNAALKTLFFEIVHNLGLIKSVPPWNSPMKPKPVYEVDSAQAFWGVPVFAVHKEVTANRIDARIIDHQTKRIITLEMSCPWITNRTKKTSENGP